MQEKEQKKAARQMLTGEDIAFIGQLLEQVSEQGFTAKSLMHISLLFRVASDLLALAGELHSAEVQIPWQSVCWAAHLPGSLSDSAATKAALERMLGPLHVEITDPPESSRWRSKFPVLKPVTAE